LAQISCSRVGERLDDLDAVLLGELANLLLLNRDRILLPVMWSTT